MFRRAVSVLVIIIVWLLIQAGQPVSLEQAQTLPKTTQIAMFVPTVVPDVTPQNVYNTLTAVSPPTGRELAIYLAGSPVLFLSNTPSPVLTPIPLVARDDVFQVDQSGDIVIARRKLLENDSGQSVQIVAYTLPVVGTWQQIDTDSVRWSAPFGYTEDVIFGYTISDGVHQSTAQIIIRMYVPPTASPVPTSTEEVIIRRWECLEYASGKMACETIP